MNHELKKPLNQVIFFVRQIQNMFPLVEEQGNARKCIKHIYAQLLLMQSFVDNLLDLRLIKDGIFPLTISVFDPNEIFDRVCTIFRQQSLS